MIKKAKREDYKIVAKLAKELWKEHSIEELEKEFWEYLTSETASIFIAYENQIPIAFVQVSLRYEYVEGTTTSPVAYLEGIFVKNDYRNQGIARTLVKECEKWAKEKHCKELASDCEIENDISYSFHLKNNFKEVNRIICFKKELQ